MGAVLGAIIAVEAVALVLLFPIFKRRMLQREETRERFLRSLHRPRPVATTRDELLVTPLDPAIPRKTFLLADESPPSSSMDRGTPATTSHPKSAPDEAISAIKSYIGLDTRDEASAIYAEAQRGSRVAQFIVGMALQKKSRPEAKTWLRRSAEQNFVPAQIHLEEAG